MDSDEAMRKDYLPKTIYRRDYLLKPRHRQEVHTGHRGGSICGIDWGYRGDGGEDCVADLLVRLGGVSKGGYIVGITGAQPAWPAGPVRARDDDAGYKAAQGREGGICERRPSRGGLGCCSYDKRVQLDARPARS